MRALICAGVVCAGVAYASGASADPRVDLHAKYVQAVKLANNDAAEQALIVIDEGLAVAPRDLPLLGLKGKVLLSLYEYTGALATYQAYLDAGARGANRREVQKIVDSLRVMQSTFLDVTVANGPATVYLDSTTHRPICTAAPTCNKPVLPIQYTVIVERSGFERWTGPVTVVSGQTAKLAVTLVEKPSLLTVRVAQPGARIDVDGAVLDTPRTIPAGAHPVTVSLAGHVTAHLEAVAHEGKPVDLEVALAPLVPVQLSPPSARLALDGKAIQIEDGGLAVPPGAHVLIASAQGFRDHRVEIPAARDGGYQITVVLAREVQPAPIPPLLSTRRKVAIAAGGVGLGAMVTGAVLGLQSRRLDHDTYARCPSPSESCSAARQANDLNVRARARALEANVAFGVAGAAAIASAVLWFTGAPESPVAITPRLGARTGDVAGLDLAVRF
jgi:PEGA domain-containing protein